MSAEDSEIAFAYWVDPISGVKVSYSLPLFHEIDFQVNEGYRRIPHGGVEIGGILYGKPEAKAITIDAFRPIDCEHASGPSFHLSERDLVTLKASIQAASADEELQGLQPVGWFISHTRSALRMTEREVELFRQFFPEVHRMTLLVKPERFKPTRFSFLLREVSGEVNLDGEANAIILPLPGRPGKATPAPMAAVPAPVPTAKPIQEIRPTQEIHPVDPFPPKPEPLPVVEPEPLTEVTAIVEPPALSPDREPQRPDIPPSLPPLRRPVKQSHPVRFLLVLLLAAMLGCGVGFWAYLQLPPAIIELRVQKQSNGLMILWDPSQTQSARYATIRVNDSSRTFLTEEQKSSGIAQVPVSGSSVKVEITSLHWVRESRGIVRYVPVAEGE